MIRVCELPCTEADQAELLRGVEDATMSASDDRDNELCLHQKGGYGCTRAPGHDGDHAAGGMGDVIVARWPRE